MQSIKFEFTNSEGHTLAGKLDLPLDQHPHNYVLFAHCFTCNKNFNAVRNISRALTIEGFGVLRFDFTGLGDSEGDFADTNFSSNVQDLILAAQQLELVHKAPTVLVGHSLGGAAVIRAACELPAVRAVATIGAPFDPSHVSHLFGEDVEAIETQGLANVQIAGRPFTVKKQFLEDVKKQSLGNCLKTMNKSLLIMHSPQDRTVEIENASEMYLAAMHPKSFVTLDGADHLLSNKADSLYVGNVIANWAQRYLEFPEKEDLKLEKEVAVRLGAKGFTTDVKIRKFGLTADEPISIGGNDFGPTPYELVSAGLGACTAMTMQMYARRKKWDLQEVIVHLEHYKDYPKDLVNPEENASKIDHFSRKIYVEGELDEAQKAKLLEIADKCPVHRTLHADVQIDTTLEAV